MKSVFPQFEITAQYPAHYAKDPSIPAVPPIRQSERGGERKTERVFGVSRMIRSSNLLSCALLGIMILVSGTVYAEDSSKTHTTARLFSRSKTFVSEENSVEHGVVLLDFFNDACGPCRAMMPAVDSLVQRGYRISKVNTDKFPDWAQRFNITKIPCFVVIVDGKEVARHVGVTSEQKLESLIVQAGGTPTFRPRRMKSDSQQYVQAAPSAWRGREANVSVQDILAGRCSFSTGLPQNTETQLAAGTPAAGTLASGTLASGTLAQQDPFGTTSPANAAVASNAQDAFQKVSAASAPQTAPQAAPAQHSWRSVAPASETDAQNTPASQSVSDLILASTVRIHVLGSTQGSGTGTLIDCRSGYALILTCGHLFREYVKEGGTISVEIFTPNGTRTLEGKYIHHNEEADLGILSVAVDFPIQTVRVAQNDFPLRKGLPISTCGCSRGADPTIQTGNITNLNRYLGPENIEVSAVPVAGRSGGGMFSENGELLGVCIAADVEDQEGMFTSLTEIHAYFRHLKMERFVHSPMNESRGTIDVPRQSIALEALPPANTDPNPEIPVNVMPTSRVIEVPQDPQQNTPINTSASPAADERSIVSHENSGIQDPFTQQLKQAEPMQSIAAPQTAETGSVPVMPIPEGTLTGEAAPEWPPRW